MCLIKYTYMNRQFSTNRLLFFFKVRKLPFQVLNIIKVIIYNRPGFIELFHNFIVLVVLNQTISQRVTWLSCLRFKKNINIWTLIKKDRHGLHDTKLSFMLFHCKIMLSCGYLLHLATNKSSHFQWLFLPFYLDKLLLHPYSIM